MIDESFHLTPLDVRRYDFGKALRGYDPQRVEQFREQVATEMERLSRQIQDLDTKAKGFQEQLRSFRERDKALNDALVSAQQLRTDIRQQSEREAELIMREARSAADRQLDDARSDLRRVEEALVSMERSRRAFLAQLRVICERQLAEIAAAEASPATLTAHIIEALAPDGRIALSGPPQAIQAPAPPTPAPAKGKA
jgi:DivIVA domain-containing protein